MIKSVFAHNGLQTVMHAIRPLAASRRLVQTLVKASSPADVGSRMPLHQQAAAAASPTVMLNEVNTRSIKTHARSLLASAIAGGKLLRNPMRKGHTSLEVGLETMEYRARQMAALITSGCDKDFSSLNPWPYKGYLGNRPELVALAGEEGLSTAAVRTYIEKHPQILTEAGFSKGDVVHIDHILPKCKGGRDHPYNYCLMLAKDNCRFGGVVTLEKLWVVGFPAIIQVLQFHLSALTADLESDAMLMG